MFIRSLYRRLGGLYGLRSFQRFGILIGFHRISSKFFRSVCLSLVTARASVSWASGWLDSDEAEIEKVFTNYSRTQKVGTWL